MYHFHVYPCHALFLRAGYFSVSLAILMIIFLIVTVYRIVHANAADVALEHHWQ